MTDFAGFRPQALGFLSELAANNEAAWFKPRKSLYEAEVKGPLAAFVASFGEKARQAGLPLTGDPQRSLFRIYRDTRFSHDKRPYKTAAGAALTRGGARHEPGVLYLHVEPEKSFVACGFWQPAAELLDAWRRRMCDEPQPFLEVVGTLARRGHQLSGGETLARLPQGFGAARASAIAPYLLWKSFITDRQLSEAELCSPGLVDLAIGFAIECRPLLDYGWALLGAEEADS